MPPRTYALWDTLTDPGLSRLWPSRALRARRAAKAYLRTSSYDRAADGHLDPLLPADLAARRTRWESELEDTGAGPPKLPDKWTVADLAFFGIDDFLGVAVLIGGYILFGVFVALGAAAVALWWHLTRSRYRTRCRTALLNRRCPDCAHDLRGLPNGVASARTGNLPTGPPRCPECGSPWPLLPPHPHARARARAVAEL